MKKNKYIGIGLAVTLGMLMSCSNETEFTKNLNYITFESTSINLGVDIDGSTTHAVKVYTSNKSSSERSFNILVNTSASTADEAAYSVPATVVVPANSNEGVINLTLNDVNIGSGKTLSLDIAKEDGLFTGKPTTINISQICKKNDVVLTIVFDGYASECSWELIDSSNEIVASGGDYSDGDVGISTRFCLDNGTYTFKVYDDYGDGMPDGSVKLSLGSTTLFSAVGDYGDGKSGTFNLGSN